MQEREGISKYNIPEKLRGSWKERTDSFISEVIHIF